MAAGDQGGPQGAVDAGAVAAGPPAADELTVSTTLSAESIAAGELVAITCSVTDDEGAAWDLPVAIDTTLTVQPAPLDL